MLRKIAIALLALLTFMLVGASLGLNLSRPMMAEIGSYGEVPVHACVARSESLCGMYDDPEIGMIEMPDNFTGHIRTIVGHDRFGRAIYGYEAIKPVRLSAHQVREVFDSRATYAKARSVAGAAFGLAMGAMIWVSLLVAFLVFLLVRYALRRLRRPAAATVQAARQVTHAVRDKARAARDAVSAVHQTVSETAALRADVQRTELLVRKAVAEARLARPDPDAAKHDVTINLRPET